MESVEDIEIIKGKVIKTDHVIKMYMDKKSKHDELMKKYKELVNELSVMKLDHEMKSFQYTEQCQQIKQLNENNNKLASDYTSLKITYDKQLNELVNLQMKYQTVYRDLYEYQNCDQQSDTIEPEKKKKVKRKRKSTNNHEDSFMDDCLKETTMLNNLLNAPADNEVPTIKIEILNNETNPKQQSLDDMKVGTKKEESDDFCENLLSELKKCKEENSIYMKNSEEREINMCKEWQEKEMKLRRKIEDLQENTQHERTAALKNFELKEVEMKKKWEEQQEKFKTRIADLKNKIQEEKSAVTRSFEEKISSLKKEWLDKEELLKTEIIQLKQRIQEEKSILIENFEAKEADLKFEWQKRENMFETKILTLEEKVELLSKERNMGVKSIENNSQQHKHDSNDETYNEPIIMSLDLQKSTPKTASLEQSDTENEQEILDILKEMRLNMLSPIPESPFQLDHIIPEDNEELPAPEVNASVVTDTDNSKCQTQEDPLCNKRYLSYRKKKEMKYRRLSAIKKAKQKFWLELSESLTSKNNQLSQKRKGSVRNSNVSVATTEATVPSTNTLVNGIATVFADIVSQKLHHPRARVRVTSEKNILEVNKMLLEKAKQEKVCLQRDLELSSDEGESMKNEEQIDLKSNSGDDTTHVSTGSNYDRYSSGIDTPNFVDSCYESIISNPPSIQSISKEALAEDKKSNELEPGILKDSGNERENFREIKEIDSKCEPSVPFSQHESIQVPECSMDADNIPLKQKDDILDNSQQEFEEDCFSEEDEKISWSGSTSSRSGSSSESDFSTDDLFVPLILEEDMTEICDQILNGNLGLQNKQNKSCESNCQEDLSESNKEIMTRKTSADYSPQILEKRTSSIDCINFQNTLEYKSDPKPSEEKIYRSNENMWYEFSNHNNEIRMSKSFAQEDTCQVPNSTENLFSNELVGYQEPKQTETSPLCYENDTLGCTNKGPATVAMPFLKCDDIPNISHCMKEKVIYIDGNYKNDQELCEKISESLPTSEKASLECLSNSCRALGSSHSESDVKPIKKISLAEDHQPEPKLETVISSVEKITIDNENDQELHQAMDQNTFLSEKSSSELLTDNCVPMDTTDSESNVTTIKNVFLERIEDHQAVDKNNELRIETSIFSVKETASDDKNDQEYRQQIYKSSLLSEKTSSEFSTNSCTEIDTKKSESDVELMKNIFRTKEGNEGHQTGDKIAELRLGNSVEKTTSDHSDDDSAMKAMESTSHTRRGEILLNDIENDQKTNSKLKTPISPVNGITVEYSNDGFEEIGLNIHGPTRPHITETREGSSKAESIPETSEEKSFEMGVQHCDADLIGECNEMNGQDFTQPVKRDNPKNNQNEISSEAKEFSLRAECSPKAYKRKRSIKGALMARSIKIYKLRSSVINAKQNMASAPELSQTETNISIPTSAETLNSSDSSFEAPKIKRRRVSSLLKKTEMISTDSKRSPPNIVGNSLCEIDSQNISGVIQNKKQTPLKKKNSVNAKLIENNHDRKIIKGKRKSILESELEPIDTNDHLVKNPISPSILTNDLESEHSRDQKKLVASKLDQSKINIYQDIILRSSKSIGNNGQKAGGFKRPLASKILPACPQSPPPPEVESVEPIIIPLHKPAKLDPSKAASLFKKLITFSMEDKTVEEVGRQFSNQEPEYISRLILKQIIQDREKPDASVTNAPLMTHTQRVMLGFMLKLEKMKVFDLINSYLKTSELYLLQSNELAAIEPLTRLNVAICKSHCYIERMRKFCLEAFYFMGDLAIPFFFTVLTSWIEVIPPSKDSENFPLVKVLIQLVHLKTCNKPGYHLLPLRDLLHKFYEYPNEPWNSDTFFKELLTKYLKNPVAPGDFPILLYCKNNDCKWVCQKLDTLIKPLLLNIKNENFKATLFVLIGNIMSPFKGKLNSEYTESVKDWLKALTNEEDIPEIVKRSIMYAINKIPKSGKKNKK